ncbi:MAG TPA: DUF488 domain-containing protein [Pseudomonadales bacterium]
MHIKRAYEPAAPGDGFRVLVDRLWPRGVRKDDLKVDLWARDAAPSAALRKWYGHEPERWEGFLERYFAELDSNPEALEPIRAALRKGKVTLVYSARDERHNQAVALKSYLERRR